MTGLWMQRHASERKQHVKLWMQAEEPPKTERGVGKISNSVIP